ncbi:uncharacterized protein LOC123498772 [Portunus trituberculatus]|uniref:uncharacterized protein LOC123498772 n=1 Tax=Portunus trituberculatus TaxID=210409 RepID=UPI001E1D1F5D|nr:uncharacterized protein LOC123498772 [Portunus trituberculatus]
MMVLCGARRSMAVLCLAAVFSLNDATVSASTAPTDTRRTIYLPLTDALSYEQIVKAGYVVVVVAAIISVWYLHFSGKGIHTIKFPGHPALPPHAVPSRLHRMEDFPSSLPFLSLLLDALDLYQ